MTIQRKYPPIETRTRIKNWCDRQERAHSEVVSKLKSWGVFRDETDQILAELISENYVNEERFARSYARGKFRIKKWGWQKIKINLKQKSVSSYSIAKAAEEIEPDEYLEVLKSILIKKQLLVKAQDSWERDQKLMRFAVGRGFEPDKVRKVLESLAKA